MGYPRPIETPTFRAFKFTDRYRMADFIRGTKQINIAVTQNIRLTETDTGPNPDYPSDPSAPPTITFTKYISNVNWSHTYVFYNHGTYGGLGSSPWTITTANTNQPIAPEGTIRFASTTGPVYQKRTFDTSSHPNVGTWDAQEYDITGAPVGSLQSGNLGKSSGTFDGLRCSFKADATHWFLTLDGGINVPAKLGSPPSYSVQPVAFAVTDSSDSGEIGSSISGPTGATVVDANYTFNAPTSGGDETYVVSGSASISYTPH
jgi:hypothetical protein